MPIAACSLRKLTCKQLPVAAAFHSSLVADAAEPLLAALADIHISAGTIPVFSNTTAAEYPSAAPKARKLLAGQLATAGGVRCRDRGHARGRSQDLRRGRPRIAPERPGQGDPRRAQAHGHGAGCLRRQAFRHGRPGPLPWPNWPCSAMACSWLNGIRDTGQPARLAAKSRP